jgi:hypothetical protein
MVLHVYLNYNVCAVNVAIFDFKSTQKTDISVYVGTSKTYNNVYMKYLFPIGSVVSEKNK